MHFLILFCWIIELASSYKILVYAPQMSRSHIYFTARIAELLAEAGHDVVYFSPSFMPNVTAKKMDNVRTVVKPISFDIDIDIPAFMRQNWNEDQLNPLVLIKMKNIMATYFARLCETVFDDDDIAAEFRNEKFDLGISEYFDHCGFAYFKKLGIEKFVAADSVSLHSKTAGPLGIESNPSFVPTLFGPFSDEMTYWERAGNLLFVLSEMLIDKFTIDKKFQELLKQKLGKEFDFEEQYNKAAFVLVNSDEYVEFPRPVTHKVVYIGGVGTKAAKPLQGELKTIMDKANNGAVFISFGSIMRSEWMPNSMKDAFVALCKRYPKVQFIWKYECDDTIGADVPNLMKVKWAPQVDLLAHPNMRAFITHSGMNSLTETTRAGVPIIAIPLFGDQLRNAKMVQKRKVAYIAIKHNITEETLFTALETVLTDKSYLISAKRLQQMIMSKPTNATERLIKHVEFAAKFGHINNLDCASTKLTFMQYYLLDILIPFAIIALFCILIIFYVLSRLVRKLFAFKKIKTD